MTMIILIQQPAQSRVLAGIVPPGESVTRGASSSVSGSRLSAVNVGQAALWLPQSGVDRHGSTVNREAPVNRYRHWSASGEVPPRIPNHSRFDNWPPATRFNSAALASQPPHPAAPTQSEASGSSPSPPAAASPNTHHNSEHFQDILLQSSPPQGFLDLTMSMSMMRS